MTATPSPAIPHIPHPDPVAPETLDSTLVQKRDRLYKLFAKMDRVLVAYSGGIDSTLVVKVAREVLGDRVLAITAVSPSLMPEDLDEAIAQTEFIGVTHELVDTHEMDNPNYSSNP